MKSFDRVSVRSTREASVSDRSVGAQAIVEAISPDQLERMRGSQSFRFRHKLGHHPSMSLTEVQNLVDRMLVEERFDQIFYKTGKSMASGRYCDAERSKEINSVLQNMSNAGVWLRLTRVDEVTSQFDEIVEQFNSDLSELYQQDIRSKTMRAFVALFVSSPGAYTNYHMDHTWNFLLKISGQKTVHLYDPHDSEVLTQADKEEWYMRNFTLTPRAQAKDIAYELAPGDGVHHPVNAPHWVQNGSEISISLSIGLCLKDSNEDAKVHQGNYLLRRFGFRPKPPRQSKWRDRMKVTFVSMWSDKDSESLDRAIFSGATRLKRFFKIETPMNSYDPK